MESASGRNELQDEFRSKNEKIKVDYVVIKPEDLAAKINPTDAEIKAAYEKNKSRYLIPEKRVVRYGLLDTTQMRRNIRFRRPVESAVSKQYSTIPGPESRSRGTHFV